MSVRTTVFSLKQLVTDSDVLCMFSTVTGWRTKVQWQASHSQLRLYRPYFRKKKGDSPQNISFTGETKKKIFFEQLLRFIEHYIADYLFELILTGHAVAPLVEALRYKPEGRGFDCRWCHCNFSLT